MGSLDKSASIAFIQKAPVQLSQAAPAQNTWYTVADLTGILHLIGLAAQIDTTGETLEARLTVDGEVISNVQACGAGTHYMLEISQSTFAVPRILAFGAASVEMNRRAFQLEGKAIKFELRKTTAAGGGTLKGTVIYAKME